MTWPFTLPTWLPWWVPIAVLVPGTLYALLFLLMPFSVFGLKGRIDTLEARLDEIQGEIRALILRLPERGGLGMGDMRPDAPPRPARPPIPPRVPVSEGTPYKTIESDRVMPDRMMADRVVPSDKASAIDAARVRESRLGPKDIGRKEPRLN